VWARWVECEGIMETEVKEVILGFLFFGIRVLSFGISGE